MALLTLEEAAQFLKLSKSTLYQRRDIPRYRLPGSRAIRFDEAELLAWAKRKPQGSDAQKVTSEDPADPLDNSSHEVYHHNPMYR